LGFLQIVNSQNSKTIKLIGSDKNETAIIQQLHVEKTIVTDANFIKKLKLVRKELDSLGFTDHQIDTIFKTDSIFNITIHLHNPIDNVIIQHPQSNLFSKILKLELIDNNHLIIPFNKVNYFLEGLIAYYQNNGFPFVEIKLTNIKKKEDLLFTQLIVNNSFRRTINQIIIKGYTDFPKSFIKYELNIAPNELFDKRKIIQTSKKIQNIPFVNEIKKPEILFKKDSTNLYLYLKKNKSNQFDGLIGFSSSKEKKAAINGYINLKLLNTLNYGENFELNWLSDGKQSQNLELKLETPYFFKSPFSSQYDFNIFKKDSSFITVSHFLNVNYKLSGNQKIGFIITHSQSSNSKTLISNTNISDFTSTSYGVSYTYIQNYNHAIFKTKFKLESSLLQGKRNNTKQNTFDNRIHLLLPLNHNNYFVIKNTSQFLFSDTYFTNEVFRLGGSNSIRGFDEQSIFSNKYSYFNVDYNHTINDTTFLSVFSDFGYISTPVNSQDYSIYSFGLGYTTKTPIGFLGIQYSIGNTGNNHFSFNNSKLHLKFSQFF
jgi:hypothetical protein